MAGAMMVFARYDLKLDSAILAEERHLPLYKELVDNYQVRFMDGIA